MTLKRKHNAVEQEVQDLRLIYDLIRNRSEQEAYEIFKRIRQTSDPLELLRFVKEADMLLSTVTPTSIPESGSPDPRVQKLDADALEKSPIKVSALPWTTVAGDGIVSELLSEYFTYENIFLFPAIHQEEFLRDINERNPKKARYCSSLLVNAMCAQRCVSIAD
jgi:hypothetical protein